ncbi:MAG: hypothetical protein QM783_04865 [Phycisphaerales bacterium]
MKSVCVLIALSACSSVAMADYTIDTLTDGAHTTIFVGVNSQNQYTFPTNSDVPTALGFRQTYFQTGAYAGGAASMTSSLGGGQLSMAWDISAPANSGALALAVTSITEYFGGASLGSSTVLSYAGSGSFSGSYSTAEVFVQVHDGANNLAGWWISFTPGAFTGLQLDLTSTPGFATPGFDPSTLNDVMLQFAFIQQPGASDMAGSGSIAISQLQFVPTPGAAALLGLGGLAMSRRRR